MRAYLLEAAGELTLVDTLFPNDARDVLEAIRSLGRRPRDLKRIVLTPRQLAPRRSRRAEA